MTGNRTSEGSLVFAPTEQSSLSHPLSPEDRQFLIEKLNQHASDAEEVLMEQLRPVHEGRPGQHILHVHPQTGQLYVCIPANPHNPSSFTSQQGYNLRSYDSAMEEMRQEGQRVRNPYPAREGSSLITCDHCNYTKVLNNDSLCPFHAYYLATGKFLGYYHFCALVEMECVSQSLMTGWWTLDDMVEFVGALTDWIDRYLLFKESEVMTEKSWIPKVSPFGPIGNPVPISARRKTPWDYISEDYWTNPASEAQRAAVYYPLQPVNGLVKHQNTVYRSHQPVRSVVDGLAPLLGFDRPAGMNGQTGSNGLPGIMPLPGLNPPSGINRVRVSQMLTDIMNSPTVPTRDEPRHPQKLGERRF